MRVDFRKIEGRALEVAEFLDRRLAPGRTEVRTHRFAGRSEEAPILRAPDCPMEGATTFASVGFSSVPQRVGGRDVPVELIGACAASVESFAEVVASCVVTRMVTGANFVYGTVIEDLRTLRAASSTLRHVALVAPFLWDSFGGGLAKDRVGGTDIYWLMVLPISDAERDFLRGNGIDALETLFEEAEIDVFDINRPSVL
jgi:hypothetical protein